MEREIYHMFNGWGACSYYTYDKEKAIRALLKTMENYKRYHEKEGSVLDDGKFLCEFSITVLPMDAFESGIDGPYLFQCMPDGDIGGDWAVDVCDAIRDKGW